MAANISQNQSGQHEIFVAGEPAWHRLGVNVSEAQTWEQASQLAHLDWTISKERLSNPRTGAPLDEFALLRDDDDRFLSVVGARYTPIQNRQVFEWMDAIIGAGCNYVSAGALGNGERMWCLATLPHVMEPVRGDRVYPYLLATDNRDGGAGQISLTYVRAVCANTVREAIRKATAEGTFKLRHTSGVHEKLKLAKSLVGEAVQSSKDIERKFRQLSEKRVDPPTLAKVLKSLFPKIEDSSRAQNDARDILVNFQSNDGNKIPAIAGTAWSLLNACTRWVDHDRGGLRKGERSEAEARAESALFGSGNEFKTRALDTILSAVGLGDEVEVISSSKVDSILSNVMV